MGENISLTVRAGGTQPLGYQWFRGNDPIATGTNATLFLTDITSAFTGDYTVAVSNSVSSATGGPARVEVVDLRLKIFNPQLVEWFALAGRTYDIETRDILEGGIWEAFARVTASTNSGLLQTPVDSSTNTIQKYFRARVVPNP